MADFLETYRARFDLPVRGGVRVRTGLPRGRALSSSRAPTGRRTSATTSWSHRAPSAVRRACRRSPASWTHAIRQLHSSDYKRPSQLRPGGVLVVGASHSGGDIAFEAGTAGHPVVLSGPIHGQVPFHLDKRPAQGRLPGAVLPGQARPHHAHPDRAEDPRGDPSARRAADPGEEGRPGPGRRRDDAGAHRGRAGRPAGAGRRPGPRRDERRVVHRLPAGLLLDRPADHRRATAGRWSSAASWRPRRGCTSSGWRSSSRSRRCSSAAPVGTRSTS